MENLKLIREKNNISQKKLSEILHCSQTLISKWEKGLREPSFDIVKQTAKFFNCSTDYLLGFESVKQKEPERIEFKKEEDFTEKQKELLEYVKQLDDYQCKFAKVYFKTLLNDFNEAESELKNSKREEK